jgi:hypothetical protein
MTRLRAETLRIRHRVGETGRPALQARIWRRWLARAAHPSRSSAQSCPRSWAVCTPPRRCARSARDSACQILRSAQDSIRFAETRRVSAINVARMRVSRSGVRQSVNASGCLRPSDLPSAQIGKRDAQGVPCRDADTRASRRSRLMISSTIGTSPMRASFPLLAAVWYPVTGRASVEVSRASKGKRRVCRT